MCAAANIVDKFDEKEIELWKMKKLIKTMESYKGNGTSMISIFIPPKDQISIIQKKLTEELGAAANIKSRVNRQSVVTAITSVQQKLRLYNRPPANGLVIYCGEIVTDDGKEKKVNIDFEPFKPINYSLYLCDNKFHTEGLQELFDDDKKFGFIIMDGHGTLYGVVQGNNRNVINKFTVDLPKKHGRGGQSAPRFARIRLEKRHHYIRKVAEIAVQCFITNDKVNVDGIILAGSADFKSELSESDLFDQRLQAKLLKIVDISYGGENGFNQAIELASDYLHNLKFLQEKKLIDQFFEEIAKDSGLYCFGIEETLRALDAGAVETLIAWENLEYIRYTIKTVDNLKSILHLKENDDKKFIKLEEGKSKIEEQVDFLEWLVDNYKNFGAKLEIVTDKTQEGSQFCKGFGGIGGILRYKLETNLNGYDDNTIDYNDIDYDDY